MANRTADSGALAGKGTVHTNSVAEPTHNKASDPSSVGQDPMKWSTPPDVKVLFWLGGIWLGYLFWYGFFAGVLSSMQFFATRHRRLTASFVFICLYAIFYIYVRYRKPYWRGWHGSKEKLLGPKLRHVVCLLGALVFTWVPAVPALLPVPPLEDVTRSEIPKEVRVLQEKIAVADRHYRDMVLDEERAATFATFSRAVQLSLRPPMPYAGLAERLQADLPPFSIEPAQRAHELEVAGEHFQGYARIYRRLAEAENRERETIVFFRNCWQSHADEAAWTTRMEAYRKAYRFLVIGVYQRALRDLEPQLRGVNLPGPEMRSDLEVTKEPFSDAERRRLELGIPPKFDRADFIPSEVHIGHSMLR